ncbi:MAG: spore maturation protein [Clostridia bacterium]|nr:spore maturation protein [Clostridia bacterium]
MPLIVFSIITYGLMKKVSIFDSFTKGAKDGLETTFRILPSLVALVTAVSMLRASGFIDFLCNLMTPFLDFIGFTKEIVPLSLMRTISGSGALAVIDEILKTHGADTFIGRCASVMAGSTETTFYTLAVYLGSVGITNSRHTVRSALCADLTAMIVSVFIVKLIFY